MTIRLISLLIPLAVLGCATKSDGGGGNNGADDTGGGGGGGGGGGEVVWTDNRHATSVNFMSAYSTGTDLYVVTTEGQTWHYDGTDWSNIATEVDEVELSGIWGSGSGATLKMYAVGHEGQVLEWENDRWVYQDMGSAAFTAIDGESATDLIAVGGAGAFTNRTGEWESMTTAQNKFNGVWYNGSTALAVGDFGGLGWYGRDAADFDDPIEENGWIFEEIDDVDKHLYGVDGTGFNNIWVVGQKGTVLQWNGVTWRSIDIDSDANMWSVWTPSADVAYVVGSNGEAYRIHMAEGEVTPLPTGVPNVLYCVTGTTEANVWATGARGVALNYAWGG